MPSSTAANAGLWFFIDENLPGQVAAALRNVGVEASAPGDSGAPAKGSTDSENCAWCAARTAIMVTRDCGKKNKDILDALAQHQVHVIFVHNQLGSPADLLQHLLAGRPRMATELAKGKQLRRRMRLNGGLGPIG